MQRVIAACGVLVLQVGFAGRNDAMQRSALVPMSHYIRSCGKTPSELRLLEVGAGTGRFHTFVKVCRHCQSCASMQGEAGGLRYVEDRTHLPV